MNRTHPPRSRRPGTEPVAWTYGARSEDDCTNPWERDLSAQSISVVVVGRDTSDEFYVLNLCDQALAETGRRQHRFDWLRGDPGASGRRARLPVDG